MHQNQWADFWTEDKDALLMDLMADGCSFIRIGRIMGISHNAVAGRFRRLRQAMGPQAK